MGKKQATKETPLVAIINGPNLNLLGMRDKDAYGAATLKDIERTLERRAQRLGLRLWLLQSNSEGEVIDAIQRAVQECDGIIINPAAYTHTSIAIRDALEVMDGPVIEVHLSNIFRREEFRHLSYVSPVVSGVICGLGPEGYELALEAIARKLGE